VRTSIESAIKRASSGFLKVVGLWVPPAQPTQDAFGQMQQPFASYQSIREQLGQEYNVRSVDLTTGQVPSDIDVLVVVAPQNIGDRERYAIDQYLMRGGAVVVAAGNYVVEPDAFSGTLALRPVDGGLREMLDSYGVQVEQSLVMDPQNEPFPIPVDRNVGGVQVREIQAINYPFFVDVRPDAMDIESPVVAGLPAVTVQWASPVVVDADKNMERTVTTLLHSSAASWLTTDTNIQPNLTLYPELGFPVAAEQSTYPLAVSVQGVFESYFKDKPSPFETEPEAATGAELAAPETVAPPLGTIAVSPPSARLIVVGSAEFLNDNVFDISSTLTRDRYLNSLRFVQNAIDWSVEDLDLLSIRARGSSVRVLEPLSEEQQSFWEVLNYIVALLALLGLGLVWRWRQRNERPLELKSPILNLQSPQRGDLR
jgi:ABC-2 type transport system permease protein